MTHPILEVARVTMRFGGIVALNDVSLQVRQGDIHAVIGPNGAGKSTLLNVITGIYRPTSVPLAPPYGMAGALLHGPRYARGERALRAQAMELLELVGLAQDGDTP
ncbi:ATP-binding cassette domain-containing protein, partial [Bordetella pertussis]|uniref:ATP-binding cassette domain-containing protein n=1 Tax=Bordetella pertussis TaxID=520 RepID=UPI0012B1670D